jgi:hypothetical protein
MKLSLPAPAILSLLFFPFLLTIDSGSGMNTRRCGDLFNPEALRRIRNVCVDTSYLEPATAADVNSFVGKESRQGHLLTHMNWRFLEKCAEADAIVRVYFAGSQRNSTRELPGNAGWIAPAPLNVSEPATQVVLLIYDRASVRVLYRTETLGPRTSRVALLRLPFSKLVKDMNALHR